MHVLGEVELGFEKHLHCILSDIDVLRRVYLSMSSQISQSGFFRELLWKHCPSTLAIYSDIFIYSRVVVAQALCCPSRLPVGLDLRCNSNNGPVFALIFWH